MKKTLEKIKNITKNTPKVFEKGHETPHDTYILYDSEGNEVVATFVDQETVFTATANDIREGMVAASEDGVVTGTKVIPSYHTSEGYVAIMPNSTFVIKNLAILYDFTKLQALICPYAGSVPDSVATEKVAINDNIYKVNSTELVATIVKDSDNQCINFTIVNESDKPYILRYFTYKEIY